MRFAEKSREIGFLRYEDFITAPDRELYSLCKRLDLPFDLKYRERWSSYTKITGEVKSHRAGDRIQSVPRRSLEPSLQEAFERNSDYQRSLKLLGYEG